MQALRHTDDANLELCGSKRRSRAAFGRSCALESTASGKILSMRRSSSFASRSRRAQPLLRREERRRTTLAFSAQPSNSSGKMQALRHTEDANLELSGAKRLSQAAFGRSSALESTASGKILSTRRSSSFASRSRRAQPLLRREE
ncbi:unnamed protein product [Coccothraustes coccothraustes]